VSLPGGSGEKENRPSEAKSKEAGCLSSGVRSQKWRDVGWSSRGTRYGGGANREERKGGDGQFIKKKKLPGKGNRLATCTRGGVKKRGPL